jgi:cellulose synthase/poly-beta-1,6-N-acetylglucosamine synthase-like glycosyltransferase
MAKLFWLCVGSIFYTYPGYPLLLTLFARLRPKPQPYPAATPTVTLLIAAHNEQAVIAQKLDNCLALDYPQERLQILVAADGSNGQTAGIVRAYAKNMALRLIQRGYRVVYTPQARSWERVSLSARDEMARRARIVAGRY